MLTETLLRIYFSVIGRCSLIPISHRLQEMRKNYFFTGGFRYYFTDLEAASCKQFQCQNRRFGVFEVGYGESLNFEFDVFHQIRNRNLNVFSLWLSVR